ncbi:MraY family glycosyltransferase [Candidatus Neomarinimicrobiota bacterium]
MFISLIVSSLLFGLCTNEKCNYYLLFCIIFFSIGLMDDIFDWNYKKKLTLQIISVALFLLVIPIDLSKLTFSSIEIQIPKLNYLLVLLWIIAVINSFNFFDGINKLGGSLAIVFFASYCIFYYSRQSTIPIEIFLIIIFSIFGFLVYNRTPAKMFMGDSGSMLLGFLIATTPLLFTSTDAVGIDITFPVIITSILIMEITYLIFSRIKYKNSPFSPDRNHLHHVLLDFNLRNRYVVLIIVFATILLSILAFFSKQLLFYQIVLIELLFFGTIIVLPRLIRSRKLEQLNN